MSSATSSTALSSVPAHFSGDRPLIYTESSFAPDRIKPYSDSASSISSHFDSPLLFSEDAKEMGDSTSTGFPTTEESDDDELGSDSDRSLTPTPSIRTFNSDNEADLLREEGGRLFNAQNDLYPLPADHLEFDRLEIQHKCLTYTIGGLYIPKEEVEALLADDGTEKSILDVGCGGGNWAIEMASRFPHCQLVGIDLAPITCKPLPPNCRFEFDDFTLGLPHYHNCFDLIHARSIGNGVEDYAAAIDELARCLRPGGILLVTEGNFQLIDGDLRPIDACLSDAEQGPNKSWYMRLLFEAYNTMKARGSQLDAGIMLERWMRESEWLENVGGRRVGVPIGPWRTDPDPDTNALLQWIGNAQRTNMKEFCFAIRPMLISEGYFPHFIDELITKAHDEMDNLKIKALAQYHFAWARRPLGPQTGTERPPTPPADHTHVTIASTSGSPSMGFGTRGESGSPSSGHVADDESSYAESVVSSSLAGSERGEFADLAQDGFRLPPPAVPPLYGRHHHHGWDDDDSDSDSGSEFST